MKNALLILVAVAFAAGCRDSSKNLKRDQQSYGVVQEGAAGPVTSTINGPGEVTPPMTATNADTTSNLTLPMATTGSSFGQPGSLANTLPRDPGGSMGVAYPGDTAGSYAPPGTAPRIARPAQPRVAAATATHADARAGEPAPAAEPPATSAAPSETPVPPPATTTTSAPSTATTTTTNADKPKERKQEEQPAPPPPTDTSTTTPPPTST